MKKGSARSKSSRVTTSEEETEVPNFEGSDFDSSEDSDTDSGHETEKKE